MTEVWRTFGVTFCTGWMSLIASVSESASRYSSVSMGWHRTTCLLCHPASRLLGRQNLRSANRGQLDVPRATLSSCGVRAFAHAGPFLWNTLPVHLKNRNLTLTTFTSHLKSYLFSQYWFRSERVWGCDHINALYKFTFTYLLTYLLIRMYIPRVWQTDRIAVAYTQPQWRLTVKRRVGSEYTIQTKYVTSYITVYNRYEPITTA